MKLPRDRSGPDLAKLLRRYGYAVTRQVGSHIRLTSTVRGTQHHVTVPAHKELRLGTLVRILTEVSAYLECLAPSFNVNFSVNTELASYS